MRIQCTARTLIMPLLALCAVLLSRPAICAAEEPQIMPTSEVRAGMKGYGMTSLSAGPPERFEVEVLGILPGAFAKGDMVLIRMSGRVIDETGVIAGMSGSPIYIDGKLVGAVAYGWYYCQIPLAGVTPAAEMLRVQQIDERKTAERRAAAKAHSRQALRRRFRRVGELLAAPSSDPEGDLLKRQAIVRMSVPAALRPAESARPQGLLPSAVTGLLPEGVDPALRPLPVPMTIGGARGGAAPLVSLLRGGGLIPVQGMAAAGAEAAPDRPLEPGMPIGALLVTGDMEMAIMGTLTWTDGERAVGFGHPMFGLGDVDLPMAVGHVQAIVPSMLNSFRLTSAGRVIGRITQDREAAISGRLGETAPVFPCKVRVAGAVEDEYDYRVAGYWDTAPFLASYVVSASSARWEGMGNPYMLDATARIKVSGREEPIVISNAYASYSVMPPSLELVEMPLALLVLNPFREVQIEGVEYELKVRPGFEAAYIDAIWVDRTKAEPGSEVSLFVRLREYRGGEVVRQLQVQIPEDAQPGTQAEILVADAMSDRMVQQRLDPSFFSPETFEGLVDVLEDMESNRNLIVRASFVERGVRYDGQAMPALPQSALRLLRSESAGGRAAPLVRDVRFAIETPWVLTGSQLLSVTIKEPDPYSP